MPRPSEIAADARALYGPPAVRPAAGDMGDGALWVDPGDSQSLWQVQSGNWRQIALPPADVDADDDSSVPAGIPILRGPYVVDYTAIPHDGDKVTLWTPVVGDVLLRLFCDWQTVIQWDHGNLSVGQDVDGLTNKNQMMLTLAGQLGRDNFNGFDMTQSAINGSNATDSGGGTYYSTAFVFASTDPVQIQLSGTSGTDPTQGRVAIFALVARAVAP